MYVLTYEGSGNEANIIAGTCSTSNAITCSSCAVSFIITTVIAVVVHYTVVRKKSKCQKFYSLIAARKQHKQQPASVYKDVVGQSQRIENEGEPCIWPCAVMTMDITYKYSSQLLWETVLCFFTFNLDVKHYTSTNIMT